MKENISESTTCCQPPRGFLSRHDLHRRPGRPSLIFTPQFAHRVRLSNRCSVTGLARRHVASCSPRRAVTARMPVTREILAMGVMASLYPPEHRAGIAFLKDQTVARMKSSRKESRLDSKPACDLCRRQPGRPGEARDILTNPLVRQPFGEAF